MTTRRLGVYRASLRTVVSYCPEQPCLIILAPEYYSSTQSFFVFFSKIPSRSLINLRTQNDFPDCELPAMYRHEGVSMRIALSLSHHLFPSSSAAIFSSGSLRVISRSGHRPRCHAPLCIGSSSSGGAAIVSLLLFSI
jgi:hypothetical protein